MIVNNLEKYFKPLFILPYSKSSSLLYTNNAFLNINCNVDVFKITWYYQKITYTTVINNTLHETEIKVVFKI